MRRVAEEANIFFRWPKAGRLSLAGARKHSSLRSGRASMRTAGTLRHQTGTVKFLAKGVNSDRFSMEIYANSKQKAEQ
jgi:hypothetical protein